MILNCTACSARLSIPDTKVPKTGAFTVACPKCQQKIQVTGKRAGPTTLTDIGPQSVSQEVSSIPEAGDGQRVAMVCVDQLHGQMRVKTALAELGYTVHIVNDAREAIDRIWQRPYSLLILHEEFGGSAEDNSVLKGLQAMPMSIRRFLYVGLIGKQYRTLEPMAAFAKSVNFVLADQELGNLKAIVQEAVSDNDRFFRVFRDSLREAGRL
jgi:predicted Zn finger-like uncharacterized protein